MCSTTILPKETTWAIVFDYHMQSNVDIILNIYSQSHFSHQIEDGNMSCEPTK